MSNIGLKISKIGVDVKTATDNNLVFSSQYPALKIQSQGTGTQAFDEAGGFLTLATHALGYRPFFIVWAKFPDYFSNLFILPSRIPIVDADIQCYATASSATLTLAVDVLPDFPEDPYEVDFDIEYKYVIFFDPIE